MPFHLVVISYCIYNTFPYFVLLRYLLTTKKTLTQHYKQIKQFLLSKCASKKLFVLENVTVFVYFTYYSLLTVYFYLYLLSKDSKTDVQFVLIASIVKKLISTKISYKHIFHSKTNFCFPMTFYGLYATTRRNF